MRSSSSLAAHLLLFQPFPVTLVCFSVVTMGWGASRGAASAGTLALLFASIFGSHAAIAVLNELCDVDADAVAKPWKPLASRRVSRRFARVALALLVVTMLASAAALGPAVLVLAATSTAAGFAYDLGLKGTPWALACFAVGFGVMPPWAWLATSTWDPAALWLYPSAAAVVVGLHFADTLPDIERDLATTPSTRALPHRLGPARTLDAACALLAFAAVAGCGAVVSGAVDSRYCAGAGVALALVCIARITGLRRRRVAYVLLSTCAVVITVAWFGAYAAGCAPAAHA